MIVFGFGKRICPGRFLAEKVSVHPYGIPVFRYSAVLTSLTEFGCTSQLFLLASRSNASRTKPGTTLSHPGSTLLVLRADRSPSNVILFPDLAWHRLSRIALLLSTSEDSSHAGFRFASGGVPFPCIGVNAIVGESRGRKRSIRYESMHDLVHYFLETNRSMLTAY